MTQAGREALTTWLSADGDGATPPRPDLLAKVLLSLPGGRDHALAVITRQRSTLTVVLQNRRRAIRQATVDDVARPRAGRATRNRMGSAESDGQPESARTRGAGSEPAPEPGSGDPSSGAGTLKDLPSVLVEEARFTQAEAELLWLDLCEARLNGGGAV